MVPQSLLVIEIGNGLVWGHKLHHKKSHTNKAHRNIETSKKNASFKEHLRISMNFPSNLPSIAGWWIPHIPLPLSKASWWVTAGAPPQRRARAAVAQVAVAAEAAAVVESVAVFGHAAIVTSGHWSSDTGKMNPQVLILVCRTYGTYGFDDILRL